MTPGLAWDVDGLWILVDLSQALLVSKKSAARLKMSSHGSRSGMQATRHLEEEQEKRLQRNIA